MSLPDFTQDAALGKLDTYLSTRSYIDGHAPSKADVAVFDGVKAPNADKFPNVARWFTHIATFEAEHPNLPGDKAKAAGLLSAIDGTGIESNAAKAVAVGEDDDEVDLFGSDDEEEDAEAARIKAERVAQYEAKKAAKGPKPAAKSVVTFDVKPWDDETDMKALEEGLRAMEIDGLVWGASKLVPVGYGVSKLQITIVVGTTRSPSTICKNDVLMSSRTTFSLLISQQCKSSKCAISPTMRRHIFSPSHCSG